MAEQMLAGATERAKVGRRRRFWLAFIALVAACAVAVYRSALFRLDDVQVTGAQRLTSDRIMAITGLYEGAPRWEHPAPAVEGRLLSEPWVQSAKAAWQGNQLRIDLVEREPVGLLPYHGLFYLALDDSGLILEQVELRAGEGLPVVAGLELTRAVRGQRLDHQGLRDALLVLSRMSPALRTHVSQLEADPERALTLFMTGGATVQFGQVPDLERDRIAAVDERLERFGRYWQEIAGKRVGDCRIDLRVSDQVIERGCQ